jgi:predicted ATPase
MGLIVEAMTLIDETIQQVEANGDTVYVPELLRVKANLLLSPLQPSPGDAEMHFMQSLELSRRQGARACELRIATDLAALLAGQGRTEGAQRLLQPVFEQFVEGVDTPDLKTAGRLLATLG